MKFVLSCIPAQEGHLHAQHERHFEPFFIHCIGSSLRLSRIQQNAGLEAMNAVRWRCFRFVIIEIDGIFLQKNAEHFHCDVKYEFDLCLDGRLRRVDRGSLHVAAVEHVG